MRERADGRGEIYAVDASRHLVQLTHRSGDYRRPTWSPDGRQIAFGYARDPKQKRYGIYVVNADGSGKRELSRDARHDFWDPAWSPDGRTLAFSFLIPRDKLQAKVTMGDKVVTLTPENPAPKPGVKRNCRCCCARFTRLALEPPLTFLTFLSVTCELLSRFETQESPRKHCFVTVSRFKYPQPEK